MNDIEYKSAIAAIETVYEEVFGHKPNPEFTGKFTGLLWNSGFRLVEPEQASGRSYVSKLLYNDAVTARIKVEKDAVFLQEQYDQIKDNYHTIMRDRDALSLMVRDADERFREMMKTLKESYVSPALTQSDDCYNKGLADLARAAKMKIALPQPSLVVIMEELARGRG